MSLPSLHLALLAPAMAKLCHSEDAGANKCLGSAEAPPRHRLHRSSAPRHLRRRVVPVCMHGNDVISLEQKGRGTGLCPVIVMGIRTEPDGSVDVESGSSSAQMTAVCRRFAPTASRHASRYPCQRCSGSVPREHSKLTCVPCFLADAQVFLKSRLLPPVSLSAFVCWHPCGVIAQERSILMHASRPARPEAGAVLASVWVFCMSATWQLSQ